MQPDFGPMVVHPDNTWQEGGGHDEDACAHEVETDDAQIPATDPYPPRRRTEGDW